MSNETRRSKIYSYFYGAGTMFQQFIIAVGILCFLMAPVSEQAHYASLEKEEEKCMELREEASELDSAYEDLYYEYRHSFEMTMYEEIAVQENDRYYEEKTACNKALKAYNEAKAEADEAQEKYQEKRYSDSTGEALFPVLGVLFVIVGAIWGLVKKFSFNRKSCEEAYDEEIKIKAGEARTKALEKLNIIAEQIDSIEPVVLRGIATYDPSENKNPVGRIAALFQGIVKMFSLIEGIIIGAVGAVIYTGLATVLAEIGAFSIAIIGAAVLVIVLGIMLYKKYEKESYVNPKTIKKLEKLYPTLLFKLGSDDRIRVSLPAITVYMFGEEQLYMYYQYFDVVTGKIFCEGVHEYFYEDIVGVVSAQETKKLFKRTGFLKLFIKSIDYLKESITVVSSGCQHSESYIVPMGRSLLDTSFVGMRNLIRQKKAEK